MPVEADDGVVEWSDLEDATGRQDWATASKLVREVGREWRAIRDLAEIFAGPGADTWSREVDEALKDLLAALAERPVAALAVASAMSRLRRFLREGEGTDRATGGGGSMVKEKT